MAKANIKMMNGTSVSIEGSPAEVAAVLAQLNGQNNSSQPPQQSNSSRSSSKTKKDNSSNSPINLICSLIDGAFFKKPKDLGAVKLALEEQGYYFPVTTLSPILLRLVKKRQLRRIKENKRWLYNG